MSDAAELLAEQCRLQVRILEQRAAWWLKALFLAGFAFAALGLFASLAAWRDSGKVTVGGIGFAVFFALFGWGAVRSVLPLRASPRIVPYFPTELEKLGGGTMAAFYGGRALYLEIRALEALVCTREARQGSFW